MKKANKPRSNVSVRRVSQCWSNSTTFVGLIICSLATGLFSTPSFSNEEFLSSLGHLAQHLDDSRNNRATDFEDDFRRMVLQPVAAITLRQKFSAVDWLQANNDSRARIVDYATVAPFRLIREEQDLSLDEMASQRIPGNTSPRVNRWSERIKFARTRVLVVDNHIEQLIDQVAEIEGLPAIQLTEAAEANAFISIGGTAANRGDTSFSCSETSPECNNWNSSPFYSDIRYCIDAVPCREAFSDKRTIRETVQPLLSDREYFHNLRTYRPDNLVEDFLREAVLMAPNNFFQVGGFLYGAGGEIEFAQCYFWGNFQQDAVREFATECFLRMLGIPNPSRLPVRSALAERHIPPVQPVDFRNDGFSGKFQTIGRYERSILTLLYSSELSTGMSDSDLQRVTPNFTKLLQSKTRR